MSEYKLSHIQGIEKKVKRKPYTSIWRKTIDLRKNDSIASASRWHNCAFSLLNSLALFLAKQWIMFQLKNQQNAWRILCECALDCANMCVCVFFLSLLVYGWNVNSTGTFDQIRIINLAECRAHFTTFLLMTIWLFKLNMKPIEFHERVFYCRFWQCRN